MSYSHENGTYPVHIGDSVFLEEDRSMLKNEDSTFHTIRYNFLPDSVDRSSIVIGNAEPPWSLSSTQNDENNVTISLPSISTVSSSSLVSLARIMIGTRPDDKNTALFFHKAAVWVGASYQTVVFLKATDTSHPSGSILVI